ncbi:MAG: hypothetical protein V1870_04850 [Candidatus Aenigmatarchaeota archaeon]
MRELLVAFADEETKKVFEELKANPQKNQYYNLWFAICEPNGIIS